MMATGQLQSLDALHEQVEVGWLLRADLNVAESE